MLNERIRQLRLAKGLTLQQVGDAFGISRSSVAAWENAISKPDSSKLVKLAQLLDTSVEYLLGSAEPQYMSAVAMLQSSSVNCDVPFVRWDLISKDIFANNPTQHVSAFDCTPGIGAFATRLALAGEWDWRPAEIPAGALLIVNPHDPLNALDYALARHANGPVQLMQVCSDGKTIAESNKTIKKSFLINNKELHIFGKIIHWVLKSQDNSHSM